MKIYFSNSKIVKQLAKKMKKELRALEVEITLGRSYNLIAQCFGHDSFADLAKLDGLTDTCPNDRCVSHEIRVQRFSQYASALIDGELSPGVAYHILENVQVAGFWGLKNGLAVDRARTVEQLIIDESIVSPVKLTPRSPDIIDSLIGQITMHSRRLNIAITARKQLVARMFGHMTYSELHAACGRDDPSHSDWNVSPEELDRRALGYITVLVQFGVHPRDAAHILSSVGCRGWWAIELNPDFALGSRQSSFADRIQQVPGAPRWRRNRRAPLHALPGSE